MKGYAGPRNYVGNLQSPWWTAQISRHPTEKQESDPLVASSVHSTPAVRRELATRGSGSAKRGSGSAKRGSESCFSVRWCGVLQGDCRLPS